MKTANVSRVVPLLVAALLAGCWDESAGDASEARGLVFEVPSKWSDWSEAVNIGTPVNAGSNPEQPGCFSKDGLSFYITSGSVRGGGFGGLDLWVCERASVDDPWGAPQNLGSTINTSFRDESPVLSLDEHRLYFSSNRTGGIGSWDLYVCHRQDKGDNFGWGAPVNLGGTINTVDNEDALTMFEDEETGEIIVYFASNRRDPSAPGGGDFDLYETRLLADGTFAAAELMDVVNVEVHRDRAPFVRRDGLELFIQSTRPGGLGGADLWVSTRPSTSDPWSDPVHVGSTINSPTRDPNLEQSNDVSPLLSRDGTTLFWSSAFRPGNLGVGGFDIWVSTRTKLKN